MNDSRIANRRRERGPLAEGERFLSVAPTVRLPDDLKTIVSIVHDIAFYRSIDDDGRALGPVAWLELRSEIQRLPEAVK